MDEYGKSILAIDTTWRRYDMGCYVGALAISTDLISRWTDISDNIVREQHIAMLLHDIT